MTEVVAYKTFFPAEAYHQNYAEQHPNAAVHRDQRCAEGRESEEAVSGALHRQARGAQLGATRTALG